MNSSENKKIRNDVILALTLLALAAIAFLLFRLFAGQGSEACIVLDGEVYAVLPLDEDAEIEIISGEDGQFKNTVTVKDGEAYVSFANCPDQICASHRRISRRGESITCLPHKLVITIEGEGGADAPDVVVR